MARKENDEKSGFLAFFAGLKNLRNYKWTGLALVLVFLAVGGFVAWIFMKSAADKLAGGGDYDQSGVGGASYGEGPAGKAGKEEVYFASEEELAKADPALKKELLDSSRGAALPAAGPAGGVEGGGSVPGPGGSAASNNSFAGPRPFEVPGPGAGAKKDGSAERSPASGSGPADKFILREIALARLKGGRATNAADQKPEELRAGVPVRLMQSKSGAPGGGLVKKPGISVVEALKSAFKSSIHGARLSSKDAARVWIAKAFDANPDYAYSLAYEEKMKAKLDLMNPNSIPKYLREQNLNVIDAKSLGVSDAGRPAIDDESTRESLKGDKDYQDKKDGAYLAKALFMPLGPFTGSAGNPGDTPARDSGALPMAADTGGGKVFSDPAAAQTLRDIGLEDYVATNGYGAECGCTPQSPCSCLPPNSFTKKKCPAYGPLPPGDSCAPGLSPGVTAGDFPAAK